MTLALFVALASGQAQAGAMFSSNVSAELTLDPVMDPDLDEDGSTEIFFIDEFTTGNGTASATGSAEDLSAFTAPLEAMASGSTTPVGTSDAEYSVDGYLDFYNDGLSVIELVFTLVWSYVESSSADDPVADDASAESFILLTQVFDDGSVEDVLEIDTAFDPTLPDSGSGTLRITHNLGPDEYYGLSLSITAAGIASSDATSPMPEPFTLTLFLTGLAGIGFISRRRRSH